MLARLLILTLAALLALPVADTAQPVLAKKRFKNKTITRTFSSTSLIDIPNNGVADPFPAPLSVGRFRKGKIKDVNLTLRDVSHGFTDHVDILLAAPNGRNTLVMSDVGGNDAIDNITLIIDDQALAAMPLTSQITSGAFRPTSDGPLDNFPDPAPPTGQAVALSVFNGGNPNGQWQLFVRDDSPQDNGEIGSWSLTIKAKVKIKKKRR